MSYNTPKIINVFYKEDRKPYDENGKAISYFGEDFIGANDATKIRFYFTPIITLEEFEGAVHAKRADGEVRYEILRKSSDELGSYLELSLNAWFTSKVGKVTLSVKIYSGDITYGYAIEGEPPTSIESLTNAVIVASDVFSFNVGYAPNATEVAPPFDDTDIDQFLTALSQKASLAQTIYVVPELPEDLSNFDNQWFLVKSPTGGNIGKLYHINLPDAEEVELGFDTLKLTATGNGDITSNTGKVAFNETLGTATLGLYNNVDLQIGKQMLFYGKANADITKGQAVQFSGVEDGVFLIAPANRIAINLNKNLMMGIATQDIDDGDFGYVTCFGRVEGVSTTGFALGSFLYYNSVSGADGGLTATVPTAPNAKILMVAVVKESTSGNEDGVFLVRTTIEPRLNDLQNVNIATPTAGDILRFNGSIWSNSDDLVTTKLNLDNLVTGVANLESRVTTAEDDIDQLQTDVVDLDERLDFIEVNGGIDYVKVADFSSLPSSGDARERRLFLTEDTQKLYNYSTLGGWEEVRQDKLTSDLGEENGLVEVTYGTQISYDGLADANALQVVYTGDGEGSIIEAVNNDGVQFAVNKDGSVNAYGDLTIAGNLTVSGTTTTVNTQTLDVEDNIITINKNQTGTPESTLLSGIEVERGDQTNFQFVFQESSDLFKVGQVGSLQAVATREDTPVNNRVPFWNESENRFDTTGAVSISGDNLTLGGDVRTNSGIRNFTSGNNSYVATSTTGTTISRNIDDVNPALTVNLVNAGSNTAIIQSWQWQGVNRAFITRVGNIGASQINNSTNLNNSRLVLDNAGSIIDRNIADANSALKVNLANAGATGNIANFQFAGANKLEVTKDGFLTQNGARLFTQPIDTTNTFFGNLSGGTSTTGTYNTAYGRTSMLSLTSGVSNTSVGQSAGRSITTGSSNSFLGDNAGFNASQLVSANNSTALGNGSFTDKSNQMVFGNASVTEFKFDRNASAVALLPQTIVSSTTFPPLLAERRVTVNNNQFAGLSTLTTTSLDMVDGFGAMNVFSIRDNANTISNIGSIGAVRSGGNDLNGRLVLQTSLDGNLTERMTIMPNGSVGVGTTNPTIIDYGREFTVSGSAITAQPEGIINIQGTRTADGNIGGILFHNLVSGTNNFLGVILAKRSGANNSGRLAFNTVNAGTDTEKMTIMPNGGVGIGTNSPTSILDIGFSSDWGTTTAQGVTISNSGSGGTVTNNHLLGTLRYRSNGVETASMSAFRTNPSSGNGTDLTFSTHNGTALGERVRIAQGGNVGIGTTSPQRLLSLVTSTNGDGIQIRRNSTTTNDYANLGFRINSTDDTTNFAEIRGVRTNRAVTADTDLRFVTRSNGTLADRMTIRDDGNVGIGTTSPIALLHIANPDPTAYQRAIRVGAGTTSANGGAYLEFPSSTIDNIGSRIGGGREGSGGLSFLKFDLYDGANHLERMRITAGGLVGINETSPTAQLQVKSGATTRVPLIIDTLNSQSANFQEWKVNGTTLAYVEASGDFYNANGSYGTISDIRVKENIVDARNYIEDLMKLRVVKYSLKSEESDTPTKLGFIAQEVEQVFPKMVHTTKTDELEDMKSIKMSVLIPMLVKSIQEQQEQIKVLQEELAKLK